MNWELHSPVTWHLMCPNASAKLTYGHLNLWWLDVYTWSYGHEFFEGFPLLEAAKIFAEERISFVLLEGDE